MPNVVTGLGIDEFIKGTDGVGKRIFPLDALDSTVAVGNGTGRARSRRGYHSTAPNVV